MRYLEQLEKHMNQNILEKVEGVSSDPANPDWMLHFLNSVEDISDECTNIIINS